MFTKTLQGSKLKKNMYRGHFWAMVLDILWMKIYLELT